MAIIDSGSPLIGTALLPNNSVLAREVSFDERERRRHSEYLLSRFVSYLHVLEGSPLKRVWICSSSWAFTKVQYHPWSTPVKGENMGRATNPILIIIKLMLWKIMTNFLGKLPTHLYCFIPRPGSVVVEHSPGMLEVGGSIPGRVKQNTLKFEVLLLCLAFST